jgi:hypothetical protein
VLLLPVLADDLVVGIITRNDFIAALPADCSIPPHTDSCATCTVPSGRNGGNHPFHPGLRNGTSVNTTCDHRRCRTMRLKFWKRDEPELKPCPRCSQLLDADALECPLCGLDLRETYQPTPIAGAGRPE